MATIKYAEEKWTMRLLPKDQIEIKPLGDDKRILGSFFEYPIGCRHWELYFISDFPNSLANTVDFERFGINLSAIQTI